MQRTSYTYHIHILILFHNIVALFYKQYKYFFILIMSGVVPHDAAIIFKHSRLAVEIEITNET